MRLFGILLIVANLLAGGAFVYLATQDWKGRQTINAAGLRHLLLLQGLPVEGPDFNAEDETPFVMELGGGESTKTVSKKLLESYFRDNTGGAAAPAAPDGAPAAAPAVSLAANTPVTSQVAEVRRVQGLIDAELNKDAVPAEAKVRLLAGWLLLQAETYDTRAAYLDLIARGDVAKLKEALDARFKAVLDKQDGNREAPAVALADLKQMSDDLAAMRKRGAPEDEIRKKRDELAKASKQGQDQVGQSGAQRAAGTLDDGERRARLAHLLIHLDTDAAWQKRVAAVVGLRRYVKAITVQVQRFKDMIDRADLGISGDQAVFVKQDSQLRERATQNAERAKVIAEERAKLVEQKTATDDAVNRRKTQLKELTDQLNKIKAEVDELLVRQSAIETQLFEIQREVGLTLEEVYRLEALLEATERERFGLPPRP